VRTAEQPLAENSGPARIVEFPGAKSEDEHRRDQDGDRIKEQIRQVTKILEEGGQAIALNLLKGIVSIATFLSALNRS
jgi:hypothetical protein